MVVRKRAAPKGVQFSGLPDQDQEQDEAAGNNGFSWIMLIAGICSALALSYAAWMLMLWVSLTPDERECAWHLPGGGWDIKAPGPLVSIPGKGQGVVASRDIRKGDVMLDVSFKCCITLLSARGTELEGLIFGPEGAELRNFVTERLAEVGADKIQGSASLEYILFTLIVMREKRLGRASRFYAYLQTWPTETHSALAWTPEELKLIADTGVLYNTEKHRKVLEMSHGYFLDALNEISPPPKGKQTAFPLDEFLATHAAIGERQFSFSTAQDKSLIALCPCADHVNHCKGVPSDIRTDLEAFSPSVGGPTSGSVKMVAGQDFKKGKEVCYSYTDSPRASLLLNTWGFYEAGAKADFFVWMQDLQNITGTNDLNWPAVGDYAILEQGSYPPDEVMCMLRLRALVIAGKGLPGDGFNCMAEITEANIEKIAWEELFGLVEKATTKVAGAPYKGGKGVSQVRREMALKFRADSLAFMRDVRCNRHGLVC